MDRGQDLQVNFRPYLACVWVVTKIMKENMLNETKSFSIGLLASLAAFWMVLSGCQDTEIDLLIWRDPTAMQSEMCVFLDRCVVTKSKAMSNSDTKLQGIIYFCRNNISQKIVSNWQFSCQKEKKLFIANNFTRMALYDTMSSNCLIVCKVFAYTSR